MDRLMNSVFVPYNEQLTESNEEIVRTCHFVILIKLKSFISYFCTLRLFAVILIEDGELNNKFSDGRVGKRFANKLQGRTHFHLDDKVRVCQRKEVLILILGRLCVVH